MTARRILLLEDEPQLVVLLEKHLKRLGFEVDAHSTASSALAALDNPGAPYDLLVADLGLPDMPGETVLAQIFDRHPRLPVLVCSGSEFVIASLPKDIQRRVRFLQKPFLPKELSQKIEESLR